MNGIPNHIGLGVAALTMAVVGGQLAAGVGTPLAPSAAAVAVPIAPSGAALAVPIGGPVRGATHLEVTEQKLKMLARSDPDDTVPLSEVFRDGSVAPTSYVVPAGKVFVVTDLVVSVERCGVPIVQIEGRIQPELGDSYQWPFSRVYPEDPDGFPRLFLSEEFHLTGGMVFDSGAKIQVLGSALMPSFACGVAAAGAVAFARVTVLGYETEDLP